MEKLIQYYEKAKIRFSELDKKKKILILVLLSLLIASFTLGERFLEGERGDFGREIQMHNDTSISNNSSDNNFFTQANDGDGFRDGNGDGFNGGGNNGGFGGGKEGAKQNINASLIQIAIILFGLLASVFVLKPSGIKLSKQTLLKSKKGNGDKDYE